MTDFPAQLPPGLAPGGLVFRSYTLDGTLLSESRVRYAADAAMFAERDGLAAVERAGGRPVALVVYDGDTGRIVSIPDEIT